MKGQNNENVNKKNSMGCVKLIRKQEIILFMLFRATKCPTEAKKIKYAKLS